MFESLSDRLQAVFQKLGGKGILTEDDVREAMKQVRIALLEADVNLKVVKDFVGKVTEQAIGEEVTKSLTPSQQVVKIVNEQLVDLLGRDSVPLAEARPGPTVLMLVGLQGAGKTTLAAKLALFLRKKGKRPMLVAADVYRPAAITQLESLGRQLNIPVHAQGTDARPPDIVRNALNRARAENISHLIIDTAGRLQIDEPLMQELEQIVEVASPHEKLLVVDSMIGQEAVRVAEEFNRRVALSGVVMTKVDGDARGGAALSVRAVTGVPIKFLSSGEKVDGNTIEVFHPDRLASRILGMGDVLSLIERAEQVYDAEQAKKMQKKLLKGSFDFEDFLNSMQQMRKLGPLQQLLKMIPGMDQLARDEELVSEKELKKIEAIIYSMTPLERRNPDVIKNSRKERIARGSGTQVHDVTALVSQFRQMQRMMKKMGGKGGRGGQIDPRELMRRMR
ncbi:MAG TPA: signal recognition particle protein [Roseiflexaceae bacterium]|nr:signal recognition particle protein [Roseiflexaceae bacterium]